MPTNPLNAREAADRLLAIQQLFRASMERRPRRRSDNLTRLQLYLLTLVARAGAVPTHGLLEALEVGPATTSQFVRSLEAKGLIERALDPEDRRRHLVQITPAGKARLDEALTRRRVRIQAILERLTGEERAQLVTLAERLAEVMAASPDAFRDDI